jgi:trans-aconitate 2-methyltransferase
MSSSSRPACEWRGESYDRIAAPQQRFGESVLARLDLDGGETVLDAGCGSGRVTELLLERLPRGRVIAVDASESMVKAARRRLGERAIVLRADLLDLTLGEPVDAIISTATFHWIGDHERLFGRLHGALRDGGRLVAQCGGEGNIRRLRGRVWEILERAPYAEHMRDWRDPWNYAGPGETRERLVGAGFRAAECWLEPAPTVPEQPREFLETIILGPHIQRLPENLRGRFMDEVMELLGERPEIDYVRLNIDARA